MRSRSQESDPFGARLDHGELDVGTQNSQRDSRKPSSRANVDDRATDRQESGHGEAIDQVLADEIARRFRTGQIDSGVPRHQAPHKGQEQSAGLVRELKVPFLGKPCEIVGVVIQNAASIGYPTERDTRFQSAFWPK